MATAPTIASRFKVGPKTPFDDRIWNALVEELSLVITDLQEKSSSFEAARDQLIISALFRVNEILVPAIEAALELQAQSADLFDPNNYYQKPDIYTKAEVGTQLSNLSTTILGNPGPPSNLNTLKEIATSLNNDPNLYQTIVGLINAVTIGAHSHAQTDIVGLVTALAGKAATSHTHDYTLITGLVTALAAKAALSHAHAQSDVTGLAAALAAKAAASHQHASSDLTDMATAAQVRSNTLAKIVTADLIATASEWQNLTDQATIVVNWPDFINGQVTLAGNRTLANPTNVKPGTARMIMVKGNDGTTRSLAFGSYYKSPPVLSNITSSKYQMVQLYAYTATHIAVTALEQVP